jgi:hypothetical protein
MFPNFRSIGNMVAVEQGPTAEVAGLPAISHHALAGVVVVTLENSPSKVAAAGLDPLAPLLPLVAPARRLPSLLGALAFQRLLDQEAQRRRLRGRAAKRKPRREGG